MPVDHPDELQLLRYTVGETTPFETARVKRHLEGCSTCREELERTRELHHTLSEHPEVLTDAELPEADAFHARPPAPARLVRLLPMKGDALAAAVLEERRAARPLAESLLAAVLADRDALEALLDRARWEELRARFALGSTLDAASDHLAREPRRWLDFGDLSLRKLPRSGAGDASLAEHAYPVGDLRGRAHVVAGWALNWTGEFDRAGERLRAAWEEFARGSGSQQDYALVELHESQRRSFLERSREALVLARRARGTFHHLKLELLAAKAAFSEGLALSYEGNDREAVPCFEAALAPLARAGAWSAWTSVLNNLGRSYLQLRDFDRAKRTYASALRHASREAHPGVHAFIRYNLGVIHHEQGDYPEAIRAFRDTVRLFEEQGSVADALVTTLHLVEAFARSGQVASAVAELARVERAAADTRLDRATLRALDEALRGERPDLEAVARLRGEAQEQLRAS